MVVSVRNARPFLRVLLDAGVFVVHRQVRGDAGGDDPGQEPSRVRCSPVRDQVAVEDEADLVGSPEVKVLEVDLFEEDPPGDRPAEHLSNGELGRQDPQIMGRARANSSAGNQRTCVHEARPATPSLSVTSSRLSVGGS